ncbi:MAG: flagellar biosynthetic protein FliR [Oscillospiraceae bacterium]|jgi:flagellar biosynthetic protein FliR|nr:flagellar biosynthetic protein FliR [Oscillospiraceae bacterium]MDE6998464.1 flagellar biosynthetic protein FliR [Oscillospiraceae bacterium]
MDWAEVTLFLLILARMSGFVVFNPLFGRQNIPAVVKSGLILLLSITVFFMTEQTAAVPGSPLTFILRLALEMLMGYFVGVVMQFFFYIPSLGGEVIDIQMGMSMGRTYDPSSQSSTTVTATLLNALMLLLFFAANGHYTLLRILMSSGNVVPYGQAAFGQDLYWSIAELFIECTVMAIKLCMPILGAELLGQVGMGILMKVIPQINVFAINIELKVIIGLGLLLALLTPISEFLLRAENQMLTTIQQMLSAMG